LERLLFFCLPQLSMHKCAEDTLAAVVVSTPLAAQQDFAPQARVAAFAPQAPQDFVQAA
jgi:hypothetical protein